MSCHSLTEPGHIIYRWKLINDDCLYIADSIKTLPSFHVLVQEAGSLKQIASIPAGALLLESADRQLKDSFSPESPAAGRCTAKGLCQASAVTKTVCHHLRESLRDEEMVQFRLQQSSGVPLISQWPVCTCENKTHKSY